MSIMELTTVTEELKCKYCGKVFRKASTLHVHLCETKRRWQQENDSGVRLGFQTWLRFYEINQGSAKFKKYADFVASPYYSAFVKFGQYMVQIRAINTSAFMDYIIKSNKKLDHWTKDINYEEYLYEYLRKEHPNDALERSFLEMQRWGDDNNLPFNEFFKSASANRVSIMISNGRISPWVLFNSAGGVESLDKFSVEQVAMVYKYIDPEFWQRKFANYVADVEYIKEACKLAGI